MPRRPALRAPTSAQRPRSTRLAGSTGALIGGLVAALATALTPLAVVTPAQAATDASQVVISEVYGGGGSASSAWQRDYVELYNPTSQPIDLGGTSVQYRSSGGSANPAGVTALTGSVPAKGFYLVAESAGSAGQPLPTPDASGGIAMSGTAGTVFLASQPTALSSPPTGSLTGNPAVLDLVGYGSTNTFETAPTAATSTSASAARDLAGADTDDNSADLVVATGTPGAAPAGGPSGPPRTATIAEIQGTGDTSPMAGTSVTTTGVVTAAYPTGGFNGFYVQTEGTGGDVDPATHHASDAVFVYGSAATSVVGVGDHVEVTGPVSEFAGLTEISPSAADVKVLGDPASVQPATVSLPRTESSRESFEGMLLAPQGPYTVADNYKLNQYAEIGLASGSTPLFTPTEVADPHDAAAIKAVQDDNAARAVTLDDGAGVNFLATAKDTPLPYLTQDHQIRVGAPVSFARPVVLDWRFGTWRFQPTAQVTAADEPPVSFGHTRTPAPAPTGGNVKIASFNVLNYFPTTGADFVAAGGSCTWHDDRTGDHVTVNSCTGPHSEDGPRGAAEDEDLVRQQAKIISAINGLGADVVSLEEVENSARFGQDRDAAVSTLVDALNTAAGAGTWEFVPTPASAGDQADEDVIRTAFIYRAATVAPVGDSVIDDVPAFDSARDPLGQGFEPVGGSGYARFAVVVNHFKSKGSGPDDGTGQGNSNPQRVAQAQELVRFADELQSNLGTDKVFLTGDFNAYTREDPMQTLYDAGYVDVGSDQAPEEHTYLYGGTVGSLDHVLANDTALSTVTGAHVWNLNSVEPVALEYSRDNYNATDFYEPGPYRASDHDPLVVGLELPLGPVATSTVAETTPSTVEFKQDEPVVRARVSSDWGIVDGGTVQVWEDGRLVGQGLVDRGSASVRLPATNHKGTHVLDVRFLGTRDALPSATTTSFRVVKTKG